MDPIAEARKIAEKAAARRAKVSPPIFFWRGKNTPGGYVDFVDEIDVLVSNQFGNLMRTECFGCQICFMIYIY